MDGLRNEYPRPQFVREEWKNLNGEWDFRFGQEEWQKITVPFVFQSRLSGIGSNRMCDRVTYRKTCRIPEEWRDREILLHFGAVDYECKVFVNGRYQGGHVGGNVGFSLNITEALNWEEEELVVEVFDPCKDETIPRGKQYWLKEPDSIWYTRTTGIWQTVWLEPVNRERIESLKYTPDIDSGTVRIDYRYAGDPKECILDIGITMEHEEVAQVSVSRPENAGNITIDVFDNRIFHTSTHNGGWCWSPDSPKLFQVEVKLRNQENTVDEVGSYFGMRKIHTDGGLIYLNNRPFYQKLVLDQGYWKDSLMTAGSDEDFKADILLAKEMGFNGCRKHQKTEDPRFLYWADRLGYVVWEEIGACAQYSSDAVRRTVDEWMEVVERDYNHPCIVTWVPLNESWGVPYISVNREQQAFSQTLYHLLKSLDHTRLVVGNDGWEMTETDICAIHNYDHGEKNDQDAHERFRESLSCREELLHTYTAGRKIFVDGWKYEGQPILLTEFGGISFVEEDTKAWGYTCIRDAEELEREYERIIDAIHASESIAGFCYTQLADVEQETNGLLTCDRKPKVSVEKIRKINDRVNKKRIRI